MRPGLGESPEGLNDGHERTQAILETLRGEYRRGSKLLNEAQKRSG